MKWYDEDGDELGHWGGLWICRVKIALIIAIEMWLFLHCPDGDE